ncbi:daunorubicin ABC transporter ATPase [candidate division MSBL1 archaeon SCGC-AAA259O05]|uniref:Daunorubicin ABC transporter ATPase n=1 Tax=candidate division MSBL1 archaeon SCGC-AAA259O05 TaxID=1698271 RepID=A0A133V519_9EURY|nr:daunorubicin ABC transporter ATPase [candidate division MSBL1 archaeon SCGC-AAA259O05]
MSRETEVGDSDALSIDARNVHLTYSDGTEAVKGVSLKVPRGEFFGFLGPNGAGKTTFIKILVTLLKPTEGKVHVNGFELGEETQAIRETIGYMDQETRVDEELTARENVRFACEAYGVPREERENRIEELLDLVELSEAADKKAGDFSGGMKKRLDVATTLVHEPPLIFLDEPTTGLDPKSRKKLWEYFERINSRGRTIFLTTQYLEEADQLCDRIAVIQNGEIIATDSPANLKQRVGGHILEIELADDGEIKDRAADIARNADIFEDVKVDVTGDGINVGSDKIQDRGADLLVKLRDSDIPIKGFNLHQPTLDDIFLTITGERVSTDGEEAEPERVDTSEGGK